MIFTLQFLTEKNVFIRAMNQYDPILLVKVLIPYAYFYLYMFLYKELRIICAFIVIFYSLEFDKFRSNSQFVRKCRFDPKQIFNKKYFLAMKNNELFPRSVKLDLKCEDLK